jgi:predicted DNA-binding transcriptional regulator AlpA
MYSKDQLANRLPDEGWVRISQFVGAGKSIPVSRATWYAGVSSGRFPKGEKPFGGNVTVWDVRKIRALIDISSASQEV